jgi:hypothetical protein
MSKHWDPDEYVKSLRPEPVQPTGVERALSVAYQERNREIDLFWRRSGFFWALLTIAFTGYFALVSARGYGSAEAFIVSCLGSVTAFAWYCANRGSKYWQENWEYQVELLEDRTLGPLHLTHLSAQNFALWKLSQAYPYSVSKTAQILSGYVVVLWLVLLVGSASEIRPWTNPLTGVVSIATVIALLWIAFGAHKRFSDKSTQLTLFKQGAPFKESSKAPEAGIRDP